MKRLKKMPKLILLSALSAIAFGGIAAGSTYALFTSSAETKTTVTAGKVALSKSVDNIVLYSLDGGEQTQLDSGATDFTSGASFKYDITTGAVTLEKFLPGDKVTFDIVITNESTVNIKYRTVYEVIEDNGLFDGLEVKVNGVEFDGVTNRSKYETWSEQGTKSLSVSIELPKDRGDEYQGLKSVIVINAEAIQANAKTSDPEEGVFEIYTATDLKYLQKHASDKFGTKIVKKDGDEQGHEENNEYLIVSLMNDLDLKDTSISPINVRRLTFKGNKHTIKNFNIDNTPSFFAKDSDKYTGLFGDFWCSTVSDLYIDNANIKGTNGVGGIAGVGVCSSFINCKVTNSKIVAQDVNKAKDGDKAGSIVGRLSGEPEAVIKGCEASNNTIQGYRDVGGLVGMVGFYDNKLDQVVVQDNKVSNIKIINDRSYDYNDYKTSDSTNNVTEIKDSKANVDAIVGRKDVHENDQKFVLDEITNTSSDITFRMQYEDGLSTPYKIENEGYNVYDYEVSNGNGLTAWRKAFEKITDSDVTNYATWHHLTITGDIYLTENWTPVSWLHGTCPFILNGNNYTIYGLKVDTGDASGSRAGLFKQINGATIKNLVIDGADIKGTYHTGAIAGCADGTTISNCTIKNSTIVSDYDSSKDGANKVGAIVGYNPSGVSIDSCVVENTTIKGYREVGGIAGYLQGDSKATNNTLKDVTIYNDRTNNYEHYSSEDQYSVGQIVGHYDIETATVSGNTIDNVKIKIITE